MSNLLGILGWVAAALLTFLAVSLAFLFLANLGSPTEDVAIAPEPRPPTTGSRLEMTVDEERLETLTAGPDQPLVVALANDGDLPLEDINVITEVSSEDTSLTETRIDDRTLPELAAGRTQEMVFEVDLSVPEETYPTPEPPRSIVEIRATTPDGISAVTTVVLRPTS